MPRPKLARRCEPRYGVSQTAIDLEAQYVRCEHQDYLLSSQADLSKCLTERQRLCEITEEQLRLCFEDLHERERLAMRCLIVRDFWHLLLMYVTALGGKANESPVVPPQRKPSAPTSNPTPAVEPFTMPFRQSLFD